MAQDRGPYRGVSCARAGGPLRHLRAAIARIAGLFSRYRADDDLRDELQSHLEMETDEYIRRGMPPAAARRRAQLASGGLTQAAESVRAQRGLPWIDGVAADIRYALRALRRSPAFTTAVVVTLALGIGANTAVFSVLRGVLLKPLPHRDGDRLVYLRQSTDGPGGANLSFSIPEVSDLRAHAASLGSIAEYSTWFLTLQGDSDAVRMDVGLVTGNFFEVMGLSPVLGRLTQPSDDGTDVPPVMVLTHEFWRRRFGGDSGIVGRQVRVDGRPVTVIGVVEAAPFFPGRADALLNMVISKHHSSALMVLDRAHRMTEVVARLAPGATVAQARAEVAAIRTRVEREFREAYDPGSRYRVAVIPFKEVMGERARPTIWLLMGAAAFVLVISVANVVNLTLMRGVRRGHELVVRAALGADVPRLRRLLLAENLVLTAIAAGFGVLIAHGGLGMLISLAARYSPRASEIGVDAVVLGFTIALAATVALLLSFTVSLPKEGTLAGWISAGGLWGGGSPRGRRLTRGLVIAQVAVSVVLLIGAGLLTRTMIRLAGVDTGLTSGDVLTISVQLVNPAQLSAAADASAKATYDRMRQAISRLPGVTSVGLGSTMPLRSSSIQIDVRMDGKPPAASEPMPRADFRTASPEYFRAAGISLLGGREFSPDDAAGSDKVVIVNQTFADWYFPGKHPLGKRIAWTGEVLRFTPFGREWRTIVGVVGNTRDGGLDAAPRPVVFLPFAQEFAMFGGLVIRTEGDASALVRSATRIVHRIAPTAPIERVLTVAQIKDESLSPRRLNAALISLFGLLSVSIAMVGIAGVLGYSVSARTHEIGIRMSLGADAWRVQRMVLGEGAALLANGLALGLIGAYFATGVMRGLLFGVRPHDPATFISVAVLTAVIGVAACWIPARRAARIDPAIAMRL